MPEMGVKVVLTFDECINLMNMMDVIAISANKTMYRTGQDHTLIIEKSKSIKEKTYNSIMVSPEFSFYVQDKEEKERELLNYVKSLINGDE